MVQSGNAAKPDEDRRQLDDEDPHHQPEQVLLARSALAHLGFGRTVALHYCSSALYHIH